MRPVFSQPQLRRATFPVCNHHHSSEGQSWRFSFSNPFLNHATRLHLSGVLEPRGHEVQQPVGEPLVLRLCLTQPFPGPVPELSTEVVQRVRSLKVSIHNLAGLLCYILALFNGHHWLCCRRVAAMAKRLRAVPPKPTVHGLLTLGQRVTHIHP